MKIFTFNSLWNVLTMVKARLDLMVKLINLLLTDKEIKREKERDYIAICNTLCLHFASLP